MSGPSPLSNTRKPSPLAPIAPCLIFTEDPPTLPRLAAHTRQLGSVRGPVTQEMGSKLLCALVREEELAPFDLNDLRHPGDRVPEPVSPRRLEEDVGIPPDDQRRRCQLLELRLNGEEILRVETVDEALDLTGLFDRPKALD